MAENPSPLLLHLQKLPPSTSEQTLARVLQTLWSTRQTGLGSTQRSELHTLLSLPAPDDLDPVVACLRLVVRKCVGGEDAQELLGDVDFDAEVRRVLVGLVQKYQDHWKEEKEQPLWQQTRVSHQVKVNTLPPLKLFPNSELLASSWPRQEDVTGYPSNGNLDGQVAGFADPNISHSGSVSLHQDKDSSKNMAIIPQLKSMTWKMEKRNLTPENRVAVVTLKLQDYTKSPSGEVEVKFQLTKDTLEAMLRSMTCISEQLSKTVRI
ncbi:uncharacterized protein A4U43_C08F32390 [Asparagus officinalis]|nr:uncharacterized protein A4U43_C08F32390 [Asparagus officinalis]